MTQIKHLSLQECSCCAFCAESDPALASPIACGLGDERPSAIIHRLRAVSSCCSAPQGSTSTAVKGLSLGHQPHCVISKSCMPSASATHGRQLRQTHHPSEALLTRFISPLGHFLSKDSVVPLIALARCQATSPLATSPIEVATNVASCSSIVTFEAISRDHLPIGATHIENYQFLYLQVTRNANRVLSHRDPSSGMVTDTRPHQLHMHARVHIPSLSWMQELHLTPSPSR